MSAREAGRQRAGPWQARQRRKVGNGAKWAESGQRRNAPKHIALNSCARLCKLSGQNVTRCCRRQVRREGLQKAGGKRFGTELQNNGFNASLLIPWGEWIPEGLFVHSNYWNYFDHSNLITVFTVIPNPTRLILIWEVNQNIYHRWLGSHVYVACNSPRKQVGSYRHHIIGDNFAMSLMTITHQHVFCAVVWGGVLMLQGH